MRRSSLHSSAPLTDLAALSAAIMASPSIRDLLARHVEGASPVPDIPAGITCGEIIAANSHLHGPLLNSLSRAKP